MQKKQQKVDGYKLFIFTGLANIFYFGLQSVDFYGYMYLIFVYISFCNAFGLISGLKEDEQLLKIYKFLIYKLAICYGITVSILSFFVAKGMIVSDDSVNVAVCSIVLAIFLIQLLVSLFHIKVVNSMLNQFKQPQLVLQTYQNSSQPFSQLPPQEISSRPDLVQQVGYPVYTNQSYQAYPVQPNLVMAYPNLNNPTPFVPQKNYSQHQYFAQ